MTTNLSKLTKGVGEFTNEEKRLEIILDDNDQLQSESFNGQSNRNKALLNITNSSSAKKEIILPKTYTTNEEIASSNKKPPTNDDLKLVKEDTDNSSPPVEGDLPIKTVNELQRNVLYYGIKEDKLPAFSLASGNDGTKENNILNGPSSNNDNLVESTLFSILNISTKNLLNNKDMENVVNDENKIDTIANDDSKLKKIKRGYSARRYLRNLTKNWDQDLLDAFISDGKLNHETVYEKTDKSMKKRRVEEDLTLWPQAYRFDQTWISTTIDMRSYKFLKAQDFNWNKTTQMVSNEAEEPRKEAEKVGETKNELVKPKTNDDQIKIFDTAHHEVSYKSLTQIEKEKVLSELLFQSALNNIKKHRINEQGDVNYLVENKKSETLLEKSDFEIKTDELKDIDEILISASGPVLNNQKKEAKTETKETKKKPTSTDNKEVNIVNETREPVYMFGKYHGAPWVKNRLITDGINPKTIVSDLITKNKLVTVTPQLNLDRPSTTPVESHSYLPKTLKRKQISARINNISSGLFITSAKHNAENKNISEEIEIDEPVEEAANEEKDMESNYLYLEEINELNESNKINGPVENKTIKETEKETVKYSSHLDKFYSTGHVVEEDDRLTPVDMLLEELKSIKDEFALEDDSENSMKEKAEDEVSPTLIEAKIVEEIQESKDLKVEKPKEHVDSNSQLFQDSSADFSKSVILLEDVVSVQTKKHKDHKLTKPKKEKVKSKREQKETTTEVLYKEKKEPREKKEIKEQKEARIIKEHKKDFHKEPKELKEPKEISIEQYEPIKIEKATEKKNAFDILKKFERPRKKIDLNFMETDQKLDYPKMDTGSPSKIRTSPVLENNNNTTKTIKKINSSSNLSANYQSIEFNFKDRIAENLKRPTKPNYETNTEEKTTLPKLKARVETPKSDEKEKEKEVIPAQKEEEKSAYFDDQYAKVETVKLAPKAEISDKQKKNNLVDVKLTFLSRKPEEKRSSSKLANTENKSDKESEHKQASKKETKKIEEPAQAQKPKLKALNQIKEVKEVKENPIPSNAQAPQSKPKGLTTQTNNKRSVNWSTGDFDPREFFVMWSYESPDPPVVVDKSFADSLKRYAELIARLALGKKNAGKNLSEDVKRALKENLERLREEIAAGKIGKEVLDEYKKVFKNILAKVLKRKDLENLEIDDDMLVKLLELPPDAFEIYKDPVTGKETLRIKSSYLKEQAKLVRTVVTEKKLSMNDFDIEIDPVTGEKKLKLKGDVAKKLGIPEGSEDLIEIFTDEDGNQVLRLKNGARTITIGDTVYELVIDPNTGQQMLKMTTKQKVGDEKIEDIMRLAANMSPETRHRYFQELLKTSGEKLSDELRRQIIDQMIENANNLDPEQRENFLKDLVKDFVNTLPPDLAKKVLSDIMKSTDHLDAALKEQMIKSLLHNIDDLPDELKENTLKELIKNMDNLASDKKHELLQHILAKVEEMGVSVEGEGQDISELRNQILKEMIKNSQNLDEDTRNKIIQQVLEKIAETGSGDVPSVILEELVKQMGSLPDSVKSKIMDEVKKNLEKGDLDSNVLAALLENAGELSPEILQTIVKNADKMDSSTLKELVKNLDKLPDELKTEMINKMVKNLSNMDTTVQQQLLKELFNNPSLIQDEVLREKVIKDILGKLTIDDVMLETQNMTAEEKNLYLQDLLKRAGDLNEETRQKIIGLLLKNSENLDQETRENLLKDLVENIVKDLPPEMAAKVLAEIMKKTENLDASLKQKMIESLLNNMDNLPPELKQQTLQEVIKNLDDLSADKKEEIFKNILSNIDSLPTEFRDQTLKTIISNLNNLSSEQKNNLLQDILDKVEQNGESSDFTKTLRNEVLKEIVKNSQNLDEDTRNKILKDVIEKFKADGSEVPDVVLQELVKQMDALPDTVKRSVIKELKKNIEKGNISADVLSEILKNPKNIPLDVLEKVIENVKQMKPDALKQLVKNLDNLPDNLKTKAIEDMMKNIGDLDPTVQKELLKEMMKNPNLIKDRKKLDKAILGIVENLDKMPDDLRKDVLKDIAKNINNLSKEVKKQVLQEVFNNLKDSSNETREEVIKQLLKKMGKAELEEWIKNSDMSDEFKKQMLQDINKLIDTGDIDLDSDDEEELKGLTGEERARKKRQLLEKKKQEAGDHDVYNEHSQDMWKDSLRKEEPKKDLDWLKKKKDSLLKHVEKNAHGDAPQLTNDQIDFVKAFNKLSDEEKMKLLDTLTDDERKNFFNLRTEYEKLRQKELEDGLVEARNLAIQKLREKFAQMKKMQYINFLRVESNLLKHAQQLTRAFVFSYFDLLSGLEVFTAAF